MKIERRQFLHVAAGAAALSTVSWFASAQSYPTRRVRLIVPGAAGGGADIPARLIAQWLSERLGQPFIIENRPGAGNNIGTEAAARSPADGYALLLVATPNAINATLYPTLNFNFIRDIAPVASMARYPLVMEVNPSFPAYTVPEFISYAKAHPGKINYGSAGTGTAQHLAGELLKTLAGVNMVHVSYLRGGQPQALTDLIGGRVQVMFDVMTTSLGYIKAGKFRALAVTTATRWEGLPDLPTVNDFVSGFDIGGWAGIGAPKGTPPEVIDKLNREINSALADLKMKARFADLGGTVMALSPAEFGKFIAAETEKWGKVIRAANVKAE